MSDGRSRGGVPCGADEATGAGLCLSGNEESLSTARPHRGYRPGVPLIHTAWTAWAGRIRPHAGVLAFPTTDPKENKIMMTRRWLILIAAATGVVAVGIRAPAYAGGPPQCCRDMFDYDTCATRGIDKNTCTAGRPEDLEGTCCVEVTNKQANCYYQQTRYTNCTVPAGQCAACIDRDLTTGEYDGNPC